MHVFLAVTIILSAQTPGRVISSVPENALHSDGSNKLRSTDHEDAVVPKGSCNGESATAYKSV